MLASSIKWFGDLGAYVDRLEQGWLKGQDALVPGLDGGTAADWANETHQAARTVWGLLPADNVLGDTYLRDAQPILDRQLGVAGLRLARFLNDTSAPSGCPAP